MDEGEMENILNYGRRENVKYPELYAWEKWKIFTTICFLNYGHRDNGKYPQLWEK
jgi:hypothetical protein